MATMIYILTSVKTSKMNKTEKITKINLPSKIVTAEITKMDKVTEIVDIGE